MEIRNLESFIQVAELGSFTKAAENLGYTQSSVSTQIRQLENELGIPLFERINHRVRLTEKGKETKAKALERIHKNEAVMLEGFSEAEQCLLRRFLEQILANIEKIQPEEFTGKTPMEEITEKEEQKRD